MLWNNGVYKSIDHIINNFFAFNLDFRGIVKLNARILVDSM